MSQERKFPFNNTPYKTAILKEQEIEKAAFFLKQGELVAFPTETVYGLGACLFYEKAIQEVFRVKGRPSDNPLIIHLADLAQLHDVAALVPKEFFLLAEAFFPGPLTIVLKAAPGISPLVSGGLDTVAVRMPAHYLAQELIRLVGQPLVAPSANLSGKPSATSFEHVLEDFQGKISAVLDGGPTSLGIESTVLQLGEEPLLLRPGSISHYQLEEALGRSVKVFSKKVALLEKVASPGMKYRHYAPKTPITLFKQREKLLQHLQKAPAKRRMLLASQELAQKEVFSADYYPLSAKDLYAHLRLADKDLYEEILVFCDSSTLGNSALMNRLIRAAGYEEESFFADH